jgi:cytochrome P450
MRNLSAELARTEGPNTPPLDSGDWAVVPDFFAWWTHKLLAASVSAMCGPHLIRLSPNFVADFWEYLEQWPTLSKMYPRWLVPRAFKARDRVVAAIVAWHRYAREHEDYQQQHQQQTQGNGGGEDGQGQWDEYWGGPWFKMRQAWGRDCGEWDDEAIACEDLAMIVAAHANVLPSCFWNVAEIFSDPALLARMQPVFKQCLSSPTPTSDPSCEFKQGQETPPSPLLPLLFDTGPAQSSPLAQSVYAEVQRMRVVMFHNRTPAVDDYRLGPFKLRKGALVAVPTVVASHDEALWGPARTQKPLGSFWADRFLVPDVVVLSDGGDGQRGGGGGDREEKDTATTAVRFSTAGLDGRAWIPYGGGAFICPGKNLAKLEIIGSAAVLAAYFDLEFPHGVPDMDDRFFGLGTQPPKGKVPVRMRRKVGVVGGKGLGGS